MAALSCYSETRPKTQGRGLITGQMITMAIVIQDMAAMGVSTMKSRSELPRPTMIELTVSVALASGLSTTDLRGPKKVAHIAQPRQRLMHMMRRHGYTLGEIGRFLGDRDTSTIVKGVRAHQRREGM